MRQADLVKWNLVWMEEHSLQCLLARAEGVGSHQLGPALTNLFGTDLPGKHAQFALTHIKFGRKAHGMHMEREYAH